MGDEKQFRRLSLRTCMDVGQQKSARYEHLVDIRPLAKVLFPQTLFGLLTQFTRSVAFLLWLFAFVIDLSIEALGVPRDFEEELADELVESSKPRVSGSLHLLLPPLHRTGTARARSVTAGSR